MNLGICIIVILEFSIKFFNLILCLLFLVILGFSDCFFFVIADKNSVSFKYFGPSKVMYFYFLVHLLSVDALNNDINTHNTLLNTIVMAPTNSQ
jgi:hypothetical protein